MLCKDGGKGNGPALQRAIRTLVRTIWNLDRHAIQSGTPMVQQGLACKAFGPTQRVQNGKGDQTTTCPGRVTMLMSILQNADPSLVARSHLAVTRSALVKWRSLPA